MDLSFGNLMVSMLIGSVGLALFVYGRKQARTPQLIVGIVLMAYPYFISNLWVMAAIGAALLALLWAALKLGY